MPLWIGLGHVSQVAKFCLPSHNFGEVHVAVIQKFQYFQVIKGVLYPYETSSAVQHCNIASKPLCSRNAAKLQRLCSCLAVEVMLQRAAIPLCSACSGVHQFVAILQHHLSLSSDCHFAVMCCTKITHRAIRAVRETAIYTIPSEKLMLQGNFATNTFLNGEIDCCRIFDLSRDFTTLFLFSSARHGIIPWFLTAFDL